MKQIIVNEVYNKTKFGEKQMEQETETAEPEQEEKPEEVETQDDNLFNFETPQIEVPAIMQGF